VTTTLVGRLRGGDRLELVPMRCSLQSKCSAAEGGHRQIDFSLGAERAWPRSSVKGP